MRCFLWRRRLRSICALFAADYDRLADSADDHAPHDSIMFRTAEVKPESFSEIPSKSG
jgi:hypothetical protein